MDSNKLDGLLINFFMSIYIFEIFQNTIIINFFYLNKQIAQALSVNKFLYVKCPQRFHNKESVKKINSLKQ